MLELIARALEWLLSLLFTKSHLDPQPIYVLLPLFLPLRSAAADLQR